MTASMYHVLPVTRRYWLDLKVFSVPGVISNSGQKLLVKITSTQVETLIKKGKTGSLKGFTSTKTGKKFDAALVLQDKNTGKVGFEFAKNKGIDYE